jgi:xanthine dehydrogenase YagR molybdenum-binding subunit
MKAKGAGEPGLCGVAAAITTYNATGVRVRGYLVTLDKYVDRLPKLP